MQQPFWQEHPNAPFATLIRVARKHCHPETDEEAYDDLIWSAHHRADREMYVFKDELHLALNDPAQLPRDALGEAVAYDEASDEAFLRRLWRDLYGDEPV